MIGQFENVSQAEKQLIRNGFEAVQFSNSTKIMIREPKFWVCATDINEVWAVAQIFVYEDGSCSLFISHLENK